MGRLKALGEFIAEAQLLVLATLFTGGVAILLFKPKLPGVPPIVGGIFAAALLFGPMLFAWFVTLFEMFREDNRKPVFHINGVTDEREKWMVRPEVLDEMDVEGPGPQSVNDGRALEVREFEYREDTETLRVRGTYFEALADSKLITCKAYMEDIHGDLVDAFLSLNRLRGRISKMGLEIQNKVVNEEAKANERGLMNPRSTVGDTFEDAKESAENEDDSEVSDLDDYVDDYAEEHGMQPTSGVPATQEQAATDGGSEP